LVEDEIKNNFIQENEDMIRKKEYCKHNREGKKIGNLKKAKSPFGHKKSEY
jgi:hypothetical protein